MSREDRGQLTKEQGPLPTAPHYTCSILSADRSTESRPWRTSAYCCTEWSGHEQSRAHVNSLIWFTYAFHFFQRPPIHPPIQLLYHSHYLFLGLLGTSRVFIYVYNFAVLERLMEELLLTNYKLISNVLNKILQYKREKIYRKKMIL